MGRCEPLVSPQPQRKLVGVIAGMKGSVKFTEGKVADLAVFRDYFALCG